MKFNVDKLKQISRPMNDEERYEIEYREKNRDWLALSAKFALTIRHILRIEKMTQKDLANLMGVSSVQITKILSGKENICLQTIAKVEKALGRSIIDFINHDDRGKSKEPSCHLSEEVIPPAYTLSSDYYDFQYVADSGDSV